MPRKRKAQVRATVHLPRLGVDQIATVDPDDPYIARLIAGEVLVPLKPIPPREPEPDAAGEPPLL